MHYYVFGGIILILCIWAIGSYVVIRSIEHKWINGINGVSHHFSSVISKFIFKQPFALEIKN